MNLNLTKTHRNITIWNPSQRNILISGLYSARGANTRIILRVPIRLISR